MNRAVRKLKGGTEIKYFMVLLGLLLHIMERGSGGKGRVEKGEGD